MARQAVLKEAGEAREGKKPSQKERKKACEYRGGGRRRLGKGLRPKGKGFVISSRRISGRKKGRQGRKGRTGIEDEESGERKFAGKKRKVSIKSRNRREGVRPAAS